MHISNLNLLLTSFAFQATSTPLHRRQNDTTIPINFLLVTTTSELPPPQGNSSLLPDVSATSLFDPLHQYTYLLRNIGPGYNALPIFNLSSGTLHTPAYPLDVTEGLEEYNSTSVRVGAELGFDPTPEVSGNLALRDGYLLTVDGQCTGWALCTGELGEEVLYWEGNDSSCEPRFIQAVAVAPY